MGLLHELGIVISVKPGKTHAIYPSELGLKASTTERVIIAYLAASHDRLFTVNLQQYVTNGPVEPGDIERLGWLCSESPSWIAPTGAVTHVRTRWMGSVRNLGFSNKARFKIRIHRSADAFRINSE